jgi:beta propeller repeat protein
MICVAVIASFLASATAGHAYSVNDWIDDNGVDPESRYYWDILDMRRWGITDLDGANRFGSIRQLELSDNLITSVESGTFSGVEIHVLDLHTNQIQSIEVGSFDGLRVRSLYLNQNQLTTIPERAFEGCHGPRDLYLQENNITSIETNAFAGFEYPIGGSLHLRHNDITSLEVGDVNGLRIDELDLSANDIASIEPGTFGDLTDLTDLDLRGHQLSTIPAGLVGALETLDVLRLSSNTIHSVEDGAFSGLPNLRILELQSKNLHTLNLADADLTGLASLYIDQGSLDSLILDGATLAEMCFIDRDWPVTEASMVGTHVEEPESLQALIHNLLTLDDLGTLTIDESNYAVLKETLDDWDAEPGHTLQVVPEPTAIVLLGLGGLALLRRRRTSAAASLLLLVASIAAFPVGDAMAGLTVDPSREFTVSAIPDLHQYTPRIWGSTVTWTVGIGGDVYATDITSGQLTPVSVGQGGNSGHGANIHGDRIVWSEWAGGSSVWAYDISTGASTEVVASGGNPDVWGDLVAWETNHVISVKNVVNGAVSQVPGTWLTASRANLPAIWGDNVVWTGDSTISGYNLALNKSIEVSTPGCADWPPLDIHGNIVVWRDTRNGNLDIYGADITDLDNIIEFPVCTNPFEQGGPHVFGNVVVWTDYRNGDQDIYGFDLLTQTEFPIATGPGNQFSASIYEDTVVWSNELNGSIDIMGNTIIPEPASLGVLVMGAVMMIRRRRVA